jgi:hypothetical protein
VPDRAPEAHLKSVPQEDVNANDAVVEHARRGHYYCGGDDAAANAKWMALAGLNNHAVRTNKVTRGKPAP